MVPARESPHFRIAKIRIPMIRKKRPPKKRHNGSPITIQAAPNTVDDHLNERGDFS